MSPASAALDGLVFDPLVPPPLVALLALAALALTLWAHLRLGGRLSAAQRGTLLVLRLAVTAALFLLLLQPSRVEPIQRRAENAVTLVALDSSRSMRQPEASGKSRFEAARALLWSAGVAGRNGGPGTADVRLLHFAADASALAGPLEDLAPTGETTNFHRSIQRMLGSLAGNERANAIILLTDGHDFELVNPAQTALAARSRGTRLYAIPFGADEAARPVRDVSVRITSFQPFHYAKQTARITASIRPLGCAYETLQVSLLREGRVVQSRPLAVRDEAQLQVQFEVTEVAVGQVEYEVRVAPLTGEVDETNNAVATYLNIIDQKIRVLVLEGQPYWDTTFLARSLRRNEKLEVDSVIGFTKGRFRVVRSEGEPEGFVFPNGPADWNKYDVVILGQAVDGLLSSAHLAALEEYVDRLGGVLVFARGDAFAPGSPAAKLAPVTWGPLKRESAPLKVGRDGRSVAPFRLLAEAEPPGGPLPPLLGLGRPLEPQPLTSTLALAAPDEEFPAMLHRRSGAGQVLSIGVDGLWRWAFRAGQEGGSSIFDRFWDQTVLWLAASRDVIPGARYSLRANTANLALGEQLLVRLSERVSGGSAALPAAVPLTVFRGPKEVGRMTLSPRPGGDPNRATGEYLPTAIGRYRLEARLPDGSVQTLRFNVHEDNAEEVDVAADLAYLRRLCEATGGRVLAPAELPGALIAVRSGQPDQAPLTRLVTLWDRAWVYWLLAGVLGLEWFLRRRWGLN